MVVKCLCPLQMKKRSLFIRESKLMKFHNTMKVIQKSFNSSEKTEKGKENCVQERNMTSHNQAIKLKVTPNNW